MKLLQNIDLQKFQQDLLHWYEQNKRDLPWRKDKDPYKIWVSEIMLQQTRVDTVIPYFRHFMKKFPTIYDLAAANSEEVLKVWEGLGYYSRARNLHESAKEVVNHLDGEIPSDRKSLEALKGIGPYTSGAILSIAFDQAEHAVDGNVLRVLSRILKVEENITEHRVRRKFQTYAQHLMAKEDPSSFNQGIMELGALICVPKEPKCHECPVQKHCLAYKEDMERHLPIRTKAKKVKSLPYIVLVIETEQNQWVIEKRPSEGLLANLWQFPMVPVYEIGKDHIENWFFHEYGLKIALQKQIGTFNHVFSHLIWDLTVYHARLLEMEENKTVQFVDVDEADQYPFSAAHLRVLEKVKRGI